MDKNERDLFAKAFLHLKEKRLKKYGIDWEGDIVWLSDMPENSSEKEDVSA